MLKKRRHRRTKRSDKNAAFKFNRQVCVFCKQNTKFNVLLRGLKQAEEKKERSGRNGGRERVKEREEES